MNIILLYFKKYTNIMTSLTNNNFLFFDEDNINFNEEYKSAKYESPSTKHTRELQCASSTFKPKPKPISNYNDNDNKLNEFNENISKQQKILTDFESENCDKIKEINDNQKQLDQLEYEINKFSDEIKLMETTIDSIKEETQNDIDLRTINERNALNEALLKYNEIKKEYDGLIIPDRIDPPRRNSSKDAEYRYTKYNADREYIRNQKNKLSNVMRNKDMDVEVAKQNLDKALKSPSNKEQLIIKSRQMRKDFDESVKKLNLVRNSYRDKLITKYKLDKLSDDVKNSIAEKEKYERRGLSVISKNGITNYDNDGNIIKKPKLNFHDMDKELEDLENNLPMKEEISYNLSVKTEYDFLVEYYNERSMFIRQYLPSINTRVITDDHKWALQAKNELKDTKLQIAELKKNLYNGEVWTSIDNEKYNQMKQDIYTKYKYQPEVITEPKKYTMDDFIKSLKGV